MDAGLSGGCDRIRPRADAARARLSARHRAYQRLLPCDLEPGRACLAHRAFLRCVVVARLHAATDPSGVVAIYELGRRRCPRGPDGHRANTSLRRARSGTDATRNSSRPDPGRTESLLRAGFGMKEKHPVT